MIPEDLRYTAEHEWVAAADGGAVRVGITHFAQDALGDIVYVQLPEAGAAVAAGESLGEIESTKSVSELYAPVAGTVSARNEALVDTPEVINSDPYGAGWLVEIAVSDPAAVDALLSADAYRELTES
ncbi:MULTISPECIES: glycine cleavage system protein GcvH [Micromonospora]|uniref:Glycine cleavage system H protein n=1 Tax=Verrucosispora sioxanthis TaxID=2499994 RepID=A0A6M1LCQ8_9ACTN|nr:MULTISPECIES: glycine cleavage system protein GcvH [Micromonospora]MCZ7423073.1 glycine cleavage system protein GcvH [Verrucosispora sp. WMMA2121]NEE66936.1 glycine cleavage system protein GcvH [Verrucosispora sioxanthis]NGM16046.1 glycine cleavage system protein GcvH [Verrucosispora sioxanthis]WBB50778.1 glycine cleavage system protein GcvH [Verrucosispora sp. WMMA2044]WBB90775.1 glycine cleavage system protein GcvH [Verrucosispora sp. WMMC514]